MNAVRIRKTFHSPIPELPELDPMIGKALEIIALEEPAGSTAPSIDHGTGKRLDAPARRVDLSGFDEVSLRGNYDFEAYKELREISQL